VLTLWDLLKPIKDAVIGVKPSKPKVEPPSPTRIRHAPVRRRRPPPATPNPQSAIANPQSRAPRTMEERYDAMVRTMLAKYDIRVRKWRSSMSGIAWYVTYKDGRVQRLIESPKPKGPMSAAIFLHEVGHHAIGFNVYKPRCLEEYHAWQFSLKEMELHGLNITDGVRRRVHRSLRYAVAKAQRRGIKSVPQELQAYLPRGKRD
jgi:hypothetical protein